MLHYILRRLALLPVIMFGATLLIFLSMQFLSPYQLVANYVKSPAELKTSSLDELVEKYGLNDPFYEKYGRWLNNLLHGHLGWSQTGKEAVTDAIIRRFPATVELAVFASIPMILGGVWLGLGAAKRHNKFFDHFSRIAAVVGWSIPSFVAGLLFLVIFYALLDWFPPGRLSIWATQVVIGGEFVRFTGMNFFDALLNGRWDIAWDAFRHIVGPASTLSILYWAIMLRITRSSMLDTMRQDYIVTARAKGLAEKDVTNKHALRNALIPVATLAGVAFLGLLGGVTITETVFNYPGIGKLTVDAATQLDYATLLGIVLFFSALLVLVNLVVDITYALIDPRVRLN